MVPGWSTRFFSARRLFFAASASVVQLLSQTSSQVEVYGLEDGSLIAPKESVLHIVGPVLELFELETVYLGLLSRMTRIATNVRAAVEAANGKRILFFPARFDIPEAQEYDGYAAKVGERPEPLRQPRPRLLKHARSEPCPMP